VCLWLNQFTEEKLKAVEIHKNKDLKKFHIKKILFYISDFSLNLTCVRACAREIMHKTGSSWIFIHTHTHNIRIDPHADTGALTLSDDW